MYSAENFSAPPCKYSPFYMEFDGSLISEEMMMHTELHTQVRKAWFFSRKMDLAEGQEYHLTSISQRIWESSWRSAFKMSAWTCPTNSSIPDNIWYRWFLKFGRNLKAEQMFKNLLLSFKTMFNLVKFSGGKSIKKIGM